MCVTHPWLQTCAVVRYAPPPIHTHTHHPKGKRHFNRVPTCTSNSSSPSTRPCSSSQPALDNTWSSSTGQGQQQTAAAGVQERYRHLLPIAECNALTVHLKKHSCNPSLHPTLDKHHPQQQERHLPTSALCAPHSTTIKKSYTATHTHNHPHTLTQMPCKPFQQHNPGHCNHSLRLPPPPPPPDHPPPTHPPTHTHTNTHKHTLSSLCVIASSRCGLSGSCRRATLPTRLDSSTAHMDCREGQTHTNTAGRPAAAAVHRLTPPD